MNKKMIVGAEHDFHDSEYASWWAKRFPRCFYHCVDFSEAMLSLANERLASRRASAKLTQVDLRSLSEGHRAQS